MTQDNPVPSPRNGRPSGKRKRFGWRFFRRVVMVFGLLLLVLAAVLWRFGWTRPPYFTGVPAIALPVPIMSYEEYGTIEHGRPYILDLPTERGHLLLIGAEHTADLSHPQYDAIRNHWATFGATVVLCEGRPGPFIGTSEWVAKYFGESGFTAALAIRDGVPVYSLEPIKADEMRSVIGEFSTERVLLFYTLRSYMGRRRSQGPDDADSVIERILRRQCGHLELDPCPMASKEDLELQYRKDFPDWPDWRTLPETYFDPRPSGTYVNQIAARSSQFRDLHMVRLMAHLVERGERVFAVVGASHVVMQERTLRAMLQSK